MERANWIFLFFVIALMNFSHHQMKSELKEIKHMVNEVVCTALEMEETYATND